MHILDVVGFVIHGEGHRHLVHANDSRPGIPVSQEARREACPAAEIEDLGGMAEWGVEWLVVHQRVEVSRLQIQTLELGRLSRVQEVRFGAAGGFDERFGRHRRWRKRLPLFSRGYIFLRVEQMVKELKRF